MDKNETHKSPNKYCGTGLGYACVDKPDSDETEDSNIDKNEPHKSPNKYCGTGLGYACVDKPDSDESKE